jgi:hypothetical protein
MLSPIVVVEIVTPRVPQRLGHFEVDSNQHSRGRSMRKRKTLCTGDQVDVQKSRRNSNYHSQKK